jgi:hypothetical protein
LQVLAWYILYIDEHWVHSLHTGTVDAEHSRFDYFGPSVACMD